MPRQSEGSVITRSDRPGLWARVTYSDNQGRRRVIQRRVTTRTEGKQLLKQLLREIEERGTQVIEGDKLTFAKLASIYESQRLFEPTLTPSGKTVGLKSYKTVRRRLKVVAAYFHNKRVRAITHYDIAQYKRERLSTPPQRRAATQRSEADVNRDLQLLRNVFNFAVRSGWLVQNPFALGEPLISTASEVQRERVLSREEEERLLMACTGSRAHLRPILICALDTAMRRGEMFKLCWKDVDLLNREITVRATNTKTGRRRVVPISSRLYDELMKLKAVAADDPDWKVFGVSDIKKGFATVCQIAGIEGFRFHDARHTALTRLTERLPPMQIMEISGHTQMQTFSRYINADRSTIRRAAEAIDSMQKEADGTLLSHLSVASW